MRKFRLSKKKLNLLIAVLVIVISFIYQTFQPKTKQFSSQIKINITPISTSSAELFRVARVIDGDTIKLDSGQTVRYIGIDAPELHHPKKRLECFGQEAMEKNKELVEGKLIRMEKDVSESDRYWRLLRYVYLPSIASPSGEFVNDFLVKEGYVSALTYPPDVNYSKQFKNSEMDARENNRGLWNKCK